MTRQVVHRLVAFVFPSVLHPALAAAARWGQLLYRHLRRPKALLALVRKRGLRASLSLLRDQSATLSGYHDWIKRYDTLSVADIAAIRADIANFTDRPFISVLMPVYNAPAEWLERAIGSVRDQIYPDWELCIVDDASTAPYIRPILEEARRRDPRIKVMFRPVNGHIATASNDALALASGTAVALLDHDDELAPQALYMVARELIAHPEALILYSDEDKLDARGRRGDPYFKPDWDADLFLGQNYLNHLSIYRRSLLVELGGFRAGFEGSQDYDLALRATEHASPEQIRHIPHILYHWRIGGGAPTFSTTQRDRAVDAARRAIAEALRRRGLAARVASGAGSYHRILWPVPEPAPLVSLLVPTRDRVPLLRQCVEGLLNRTDYPNLEILILDNDSRQAETLRYFETLQKDSRVRVLPCPGPFNISVLHNRGVEAARGEFIGLINDGLKVIDADWLREMIGHASRPEVGAVGAKLLHADDRLRHAGMVLGLGGVAGDRYKFASRNAAGSFGRLRLVQNLSACSAACLVLRRAVYGEVGGLDEVNLANAFRDVDFCLKLRERGYRIIWTPYAELYHLEPVLHENDSIPECQAEIRFMRQRWGDLLEADPYYNPNLAFDSLHPALAFPPRALRPWRHDETVTS